MRDAPDGIELLKTAGKVLREDLLALIPATHRQDALMVANAIGIAMRQLEQGDYPLFDELQSLQRLGVASTEIPNGRQTLQAALSNANEELALLLRSCYADPGRPQREAILQHLRTVAAQRLSESNPKYAKD